MVCRPPARIERVFVARPAFASHMLMARLSTANAASFTLAQRRMGMAGARDVLGGGAKLHGGLGTIFAFPVAAREGSLVAYGPDYLHMYRRDKPADLPVEQPTKIELLVNLQVAKVLGIEVPMSLLVRADDLLE